jgi:signal transduction histidine kinase
MKTEQESNKEALQRMYVRIAAFVAAISNVILLGLPWVNKSPHLMVSMIAIIIFSLIFILWNNFQKISIAKEKCIHMLIFVFPFHATILILENQNTFWLYIYFMVTLFFIMDVIKSDFVDLLIGLSIVSAFVAEWLLAAKWDLSSHIKYFYVSILGFILFGSYHQYKFKKYTESQIQKLRLLGGAIAHELRTPLSAIASGVQGLKGAMPVLVESYQLRCAEKKELGRYEPYQLNALLETPDSIFQTATESSMMIDMLLMKIKTDSAPIDYSTPISAASICQKTLSEYPFRLGEKEKITLHTNNDFVFLTHEKSFKNVILNLLKNALYQIAKHSKGEIEIWLTGNNRHNTIHFKDTASGIKENDLINLFTESHRISENGTGIGLPFCKLIVENSGGNIECRSVFGEYTEFILQFPTITLTKETQ